MRFNFSSPTHTFNWNIELFESVIDKINFNTSTFNIGLGCRLSQFNLTPLHFNYLFSLASATCPNILGFIVPTDMSYEIHTFLENELIFSIPFSPPLCYYSVCLSRRYSLILPQHWILVNSTLNLSKKFNDSQLQIEYIKLVYQNILLYGIAGLVIHKSRDIIMHSIFPFVKSLNHMVVGNSVGTNN